MSTEEPVRKRGVPRTPPMQYRSPVRSDSESPRPIRNRSRSPAPGRPRTPPSPPPDNRGDRDRYRRSGDRDHRSSGRDPDDGLHFSNYYRSRFGGQSPEEYQNLRVTNIDPKVSNDELLDALEKMRRYGDLHVKVVNQRDPYGRIAYVNFERSQDARDARKGHLHKLVAALGKSLAVDPTGVVRDQEGRLVNSNSSGPSASGGGYRSGRDYSSDRGGGRGGYRGGGGGGGGGYYRDRGDRYEDERDYRGYRR